MHLNSHFRRHFPLNCPFWKECKNLTFHYQIQVSVQCIFQSPNQFWLWAPCFSWSHGSSHYRHPPCTTFQGPVHSVTVSKPTRFPFPFMFFFQTFSLLGRISYSWPWNQSRASTVLVMFFHNSKRKYLVISSSVLLPPPVVVSLLEHHIPAVQELCCKHSCSSQQSPQENCLKAALFEKEFGWLNPQQSSWASKLNYTMLWFNDAILYFSNIDQSIFCQLTPAPENEPWQCLIPVQMEFFCSKKVDFLWQKSAILFLCLLWLFTMSFIRMHT